MNKEKNVFWLSGINLNHLLEETVRYCPFFLSGKSVWFEIARNFLFKNRKPTNFWSQKLIRNFECKMSKNIAKFYEKNQMGKFILKITFWSSDENFRKKILAKNFTNLRLFLDFSCVSTSGDASNFILWLFSVGDIIILYMILSLCFGLMQFLSK